MSPERHPAIRVLVVDDHALVRRGISDFLAAEPGIEVAGEAAGARQALEELARLDAAGRRPDVVLMDLQMEPVDGIGATRLIRARYAGIAVVVLTSFSDSARFHAALEAGVSGYVLKESDPDALASAVRAAHRGQVQLDAGLTRGLAGARGDETQAVSLTDREREILKLVAAGKPNKAIAAELFISERTARSHVSHILTKLGVASRTQAALWAVREGYADRT